MKILVFIHSLSAGGAERVTANLANYWAEKGWKITIVTMTSKEKDFYELHPTIRRIALHADQKSSRLIAAISHNFNRVKALREVLKQEQPDIALAMMTTANCLLALAASGTGIPTIGSEHIHPPAMPLGRVWKWLRKTTYSRLTVLTALTSKSAEWLRQNTWVKEVEIIQNAVPYPLDRQPPFVAPCEIVPECRKLLLGVGRLAWQKGFDWLITAFGRLAGDFRDWDLAIVGDGPELETLREMAARLNLSQRIFFPGKVGNLRDWYEAADLYVMSSRFEGFGNTLAEALAHGLPAVSMDCDTGPRDIIRPGIDGLLTPPNDVEALAQGVATLMKDDKLRQQMAARAVEARRRFSLEKISGQWEALFMEILK